jgi:hypothetical protein
MQNARATFNVKALKNDAGYVVEVQWPSGRIEVGVPPPGRDAAVSLICPPRCGAALRR